MYRRRFVYRSTQFDLKSGGYPIHAHLATKSGLDSEMNRSREASACFDTQFFTCSIVLCILPRMSDGHSRTDIFSFDRKPKSSFPSSNFEPYFPYADAWKEFDKLKKRASGRGPFGFARSIVEGSLVSMGLLGWHTSRSTTDCQFWWDRAFSWLYNLPSSQ
jgi:hypothetical protein